MIRLFDIIWGKRIGSKETDFDNVQINPMEEINSLDKTTHVLFLPATTYKSNYFKKRIVPKEGNVIIYAMPHEILSTDMTKYRKMYLNYLENAQTRIKQRNVKKENLTIIGLSMGYIPAYMLANTFGCKKLVVVAPVCDIPYETANSVAGKIHLKRAKVSEKKMKQINKELLELSPIKNYKNIRGEIEMYMGSDDYIVPSEKSQELAKKMKEEGKKVKVKIYRGIGHVLTIWRFAISKFD